MLSHFGCVWLFVTPCTTAHQAPLSMGFSRQENWSGLLCSSPGDLPDPGIEPESVMSPALAGRFLTNSAVWEAQFQFQLQGITMDNIWKCTGVYPFIYLWLSMCSSLKPNKSHFICDAGPNSNGILISLIVQIITSVSKPGFPEVFTF